MPYGDGLLIALLDKVTAAVDNTRPSFSVAQSPTVIAAADITVPLKVLSVAIVVVPAGTQNILVFAFVAPPMSATIELAAVFKVEVVRKIYRPAPFRFKVPVKLTAPV